MQNICMKTFPSACFNNIPLSIINTLTFTFAEGKRKPTAAYQSISNGCLHLCASVKDPHGVD